MSAQMRNLGDKMRSRRRNGGGETWSDELTPLSERAPAIRHRRHRRQNAKTPKLKMCLG